MYIYILSITFYLLFFLRRTFYEETQILLIKLNIQTQYFTDNKGDDTFQKRDERDVKQRDEMECLHSMQKRFLLYPADRLARKRSFLCIVYFRHTLLAVRRLG